MSDHYSIQIRDQIAAQIAATSYTVFTSRGFAIDQASLPAIAIVVGADSIDVESLADTIEHHEQEFNLHVYASDSDDVDREVMAAVKTALDSLKADDSLGGLVEYSYPEAVSEPARDQGNKKYVLCEITYKVIYTR